VRGFDSLKMEEAPRPEFVARHARQALTRGLAVDLLSLAERPS
jgi:hypothetical protein